MAKDDKQPSVDRIMRQMREENPELSDQEFQELFDGIMLMGAIAHQKTQEGKIFITDDPTRTH